MRTISLRMDLMSPWQPWRVLCGWGWCAAISLRCPLMIVSGVTIVATLLSRRSRFAIGLGVFAQALILDLYAPQDFAMTNGFEAVIRR